MKLPIAGNQPRQKSSHTRLLRRSSKPLVYARSRSSRLDALIVPAARPASSLSLAIALSACTGTLLVVICSRQAKVDQVAARVAATPGARALLVDMSDAYALPRQPCRTSMPQFRAASGGRESDLSLKRNLGLLLARLCGWNKISFLDDDVTLERPEVFARLASELDENQIAGMVCRDYPDNSVFCHARRLAKRPQGNFVSGSVLGVHCSDLPLPFFPDIYNEDWFFFSRDVARQSLPYVGDATQAPYEPFADPNRARHQEFGDLLAEGLYSLIGDINDPALPYHRLLSCATGSFWRAFINARHSDLLETRRRLERFGNVDGDDLVAQALRSLEAAEGQLLKVITADTCTDFLAAWQEDLAAWEKITEGTSNVGGVTRAMSHLNIENWRVAQFGDPHVENTSAVDFLFGFDHALSGSVSLSRGRRSNRSASMSWA
jgi:hypothetical protein